ncbi:hypothetical protein P9B03_03405 [Metasolibacillus meyeri]|uniref:Uncharacterized protein n=1 Tax=Metasolibacillus meyeri TaxID=1071052 RepID=A0AAW9NSU3_9BACL|nr:hypothetical protein [Metasolibacillus meyeri]MEC1177520.1 hypothetical protein [Metasolibacillus meyeri]
MNQHEQTIRQIQLNSTSPSLHEQVAQFALTFRKEVEALDITQIDELEDSANKDAYVKRRIRWTDKQ